MKAHLPLVLAVALMLLGGSRASGEPRNPVPSRQEMTAFGRAEVVKRCRVDPSDGRLWLRVRETEVPVDTADLFLYSFDCYYKYDLKYRPLRGKGRPTRLLFLQVSSLEIRDDFILGHTIDVVMPMLGMDGEIRVGRGTIETGLPPEVIQELRDLQAAQEERD